MYSTFCYKWLYSIKIEDFKLSWKISYPYHDKDRIIVYKKDYIYFLCIYDNGSFVLLSGC